MRAEADLILQHAFCRDATYACLRLDYLGCIMNLQICTLP